MKRLLATVYLALSIATANAAIIYNVDRTIVNDNITGAVTGSITTDGTIGVLGDSNIDNWLLRLTITDVNTGDVVLDDTIDKDTGILMLGGNAVEAFETHLEYDFTIDAGNYLYFRSNSLNFWCLETKNCSDGPDFSEQIGKAVSGGDQIFAFENRAGQVVTFATVIPVPAAIWLFGSGLLGLLGLARIRR